MFSRGNISEKARILGLGSTKFRGLDEDELGQPVKDVAVVEMYAGIGYFVFSYLKRGVGRVWAWEINPWSIEGLRRGCNENGWAIKVVQVDDGGSVEGGIRELAESLAEEDRVVAFLGDNCFAADVLHRLKAELRKRKAWRAIRHVNLGLLPSSRQSWKGSVELLDPKREGWIHVHENVQIEGIGAMKGAILEEFANLLASSRDICQPESARDTVTCVHVEEVKTYAPGVMHCVFDLRVAATSEDSEEVLE
jgi:tRNA wybutosine-synthesizing protein 2